MRKWVDFRHAGVSGVVDQALARKRDRGFLFPSMPCDCCQQTLDAIRRVESLVQVLVASLAEEQGDEPQFDLDGKPAGSPRQEGQSLG